MPKLSSLLFNIPDDYKPVAALGIGALMLVFLALFHGAGLQRILHRNKRGEVKLRSRQPSLFAASMLFGWAVFLMLMLHLVEVLLWAGLLLWLGLAPRVANAIYFCANAYTTLGMGNLDLGEHWRTISPIIAISGLFTFAWTTSSLVDVVASHTRLIERLEVERLHEIEMRNTARKAEWDTLSKERAAESELHTQTESQSAGQSFAERRKAHAEEEQKIKALRAAAHDEIAGIRRQERSEEDKLGTSDPGKEDDG